MVAKGELRTGEKKTARNNRVKLGTYTFEPAGHKVTADLYVWDHNRIIRFRPADPYGSREATGQTPSKDCIGKPRTASSPLLYVRRCEVHTAQGFTHTPSEHLTGTYHIQSASDGGQGQLVIDWHGGGTEGWVLSGFGSGGKLAELEAGAQSSSSKRAGVSYADYTGGFAYGSNTPLDVRRTLKSAQAGGNVGQEAWTWARDTITHVKEGRTGPTRRGYNLHAFRSCAGSECLTWTHRSSNSVNGPCSRGAGCPAKGGPGGDDTIQYYIARVGADRRDTEWHWCTCLAREHGETCYSRNSHVQPMLQVLDDDGVFRGWVGVEASFYNSPARKNPDGSIEDRTLSDSLAVFRRMR